MTKLDSNGDIVWNRSYQVDDVTRGISVRRANEDPTGFVMLGHTQTLAQTDRGIFVMRTDSLGNPLWTKQYGAAPGRNFHPKSEIRSCGSGYIVAGSLTALTEGGEVGFLLRIDDAGTLQWMRFYQQAGTGSFDFTHFNDVQQTATGFVVTGYSFSQVPPGMFQNTTETLIMTTDALGVPVWAQQYPYVEGADEGNSIEVLSQGYAVLGDLESFGMPACQLFTVDNVGNIDWYRRIDGFMDGGYGVQDSPANGTLHVLANGDFVFPGGTFGSDAALLNFDSLGNFVTGQSYGFDSWHFASSSLVEPAGAGYTFVGPVSGGVNLDYHVARTTATFTSGCDEAPFTPTVTSPVVTPIALTYNTLSVTQEVVRTPLLAPLTWDEEIFCQGSDCLDAVPITCSVTGLSVNITWAPLPATLDTAELWRNGAFLATVTGLTSYTDTPPLGVVNYELRLFDVVPTCDHASSFCKVLVGVSVPVINVTDVIVWPWKPAPDGPIICWADHLISKGRNPRILPSLDQITPQLGSAVPGVTPVVWLSLGQFPFDYRLTQAEGQILADFVAAGGSLYIEGSDVAFGSQTALSQLDGVTASSGGTLQDSVPALTGLDSGLGFDATQLSAQYRGSGRFIDHLVPDGPGAAAVFQNAANSAQTTAVFYDASVTGAGTHRVVTSSTLIEGYAGNPNLLLDGLLDALSPASAPDFVRGDGNGDGTVDIGDPIYSLAYLFAGGVGSCLDALDANDDGSVDIGDPVYTLTFQFAGGPAPLSPYPNCGTDASNDTLGCALTLACP